MLSVKDSVSGGGQFSPSSVLKRETSAVNSMIDNHELVDDARIRYGFKIAGMGLLVDSDEVAEVVPRPNLARIPRTPAWFSGLSNLRGTLIPMFDLKLLMGLDDKGRGKEKFSLIIGQGDKAMGFFIEQYPIGLENMEAVAEQPPLPMLLLPFVGQAYFTNESIYVELDYSHFFSSLSEKLKS